MTWEMGQNCGHVLPLLPIAKALRRAGHQVVFALKSVREVGKVVAEEGFALLQAPVAAGVVEEPETPPETMAEILCAFDFDKTGALRARVDAWRSLMRQVSPQLVVASYAPVSLLAARTLGVRTALVGMAFELPPPGNPSATFRPWLKTPHHVLRRAEDAVVASVNAAVGPHDVSVASVCDVFEAERQLLWTFPELDPHAPRRSLGNAPIYCGGVFTSTSGGAPEWVGGRSRKWLGYLRCHGRRLEELVAALESVDASFSLVMPELSDAEVEGLSRSNVAITNKPLHLGNALAQADGLLSYGGHGTVCASLLHGLPMVLLPEHMEGFSIARQVVRLGAAKVLHAWCPGSAADACRELLDDGRYRGAAKRFQTRYAGFDASVQAGRMARVLHEMI